MKELKRQFHLAKIMLRGNNPEQRQKALEALRRIRSEADGTTLANDAGKELEKYESPPNERDPELEKYARRFDEIHELTDPRLIRLLRELQEKPGIAMLLGPSVVREIGKMIEAVLPQITEGMPAQDRDALNNFVKTVSQIEAYRAPELKPLRKALFQLKYQETRRKIDGAIDQWAIDDAWRLYEELDPRPDGFEDDVRQVQVGIYEIEQLRQSVEESLNQLLRQASGPLPDAWLNLRLLVDLIRKCAGYLNDARLPENWRKKVNDGLEQGASAAGTFLERQAASSVALKELREFWGRYNELELAGVDDLLITREDWFRGGLNLIEKNAEMDVKRADSPEALKEVARKLLEESSGLPPFVVGRMKELADEVRAAAANWQTMNSGDEFKLLAESHGALPIPDTLRKVAPEFRQLLDQINEALARIKADPAPGEDAYQDGVRIADEILAHFKGHRGAEKLKKAAERGILCWQMDEALRQWRVDEFLKLCQETPPEGVYHELAQNGAALRGLARLAGQEDFRGWRGAAKWWESWRDEKKELPHPESDWPDSLRRAVLEQEECHRDQWCDTLEKLVSSELAPEEAQAAAESLEGELQSLSLQVYRQALKRKAVVGRAQRSIDERLFDKARKEIAELDEDDEDLFPLRTRLNVAEAGIRPVGELANVLFREWQYVARYLPDAHSILLETVRKAWKGEQIEALKSLKMVLDRVGGGGAESPELDQLREWAEWLKVEQTIRTDRSLLSVNQMVDYLRRAESNKSAPHKQRLERLARHWEAEGDTVMSAWAYQAFNRFDPSILPSSRDPVEDLIAEGARLAERALGDLKSIGAEEPRGKVEKLISELQTHEKKWKELDVYLNLLHFKDNRRERPPEFTKVLEKSKSLLQALDSIDSLRKSDWRRDETLTMFDATGRDIAALFDGFALQARLLAQLEEWTPLTRLNYLEARLTETAEKCGSDSQLEVYEERHFADLRCWIVEIIEVLDKTGADSWKMWRIASAEYCDLVYDKAGILLPPIEPPDLRKLADCVKLLSKEEQDFKQAIEYLTEHRPNVLAGGSFDPQLHTNYLQGVPPLPPGSRKVYRRFDRFATREPIRTILKRSQAYLHEWARKYLDEGIP